MKGVIYKYTNIINNKVYIGQTYNEPKRREKWKCINSPYAGEFINRARFKYGLDAFTYEVLAEINSDDEKVLRELLDEAEIKYIKIYKANDENYGYNLTEGGLSGKGQVFSEETRKRMSIAQKGLKKPMSEHGKLNISKAHKGPRPWTWKKVAQYDKNTGELIKIWDSLTSVIRYFGDASPGNLVNAINGKHRYKSYRGYKWKYYETTSSEKI